MVFDPEEQLPGERETANEMLFDAQVRHQIFLLRFAGGLSNEMIELLNAVEEDIVGQIRRRFKAGAPPTPARLARAERLIQDINKIRTSALTESSKRLIDSMRELATNEAKFIKRAVETVIPVEVDLTTPAPQTIRAAATARPFEGKTLRKWAQSIAQADLNRIAEQIRIGVVQGESGADIARRIVGRARLRGTDGVTQLTRRAAQGIARTATIHTTNAARGLVLADNADIISEEVYTATLDARTTRICSSLDGRRFPPGEGPQPPLHFNCRSLRVAVIGRDLIGSRPAKPVTERQLLREYAERNRLSGITGRGTLPRGHKGAFDAFSRRRVRELTGRVPAKVNYQQWLNRQSAEFQDDVLGATRARLFRRGGLTLDKFMNRAGDEIPLSALARSDASAFRAAGLDPGDFD